MEWEKVGIAKSISVELQADPHPQISAKQCSHSAVRPSARFLATSILILVCQFGPPTLKLESA